MIILQTVLSCVQKIKDDEVVVVFDIDDDIVEHVYHRNQFIDGMLPDVGQRLRVSVRVTDCRTRKDAQPATDIAYARSSTARECQSGPDEF